MKLFMVTLNQMQQSTFGTLFLHYLVLYNRLTSARTGCNTTHGDYCDGYVRHLARHMTSLGTDTG